MREFAALRGDIRLQLGVVSLGQCVAAGMPEREPARRVARGQWQRAHPGVFAVQTGPLSAEQRLWAGVLHAGSGAMVANESALWALRRRRQRGALPAVVVAVGHGRRVRATPGLTVVRLSRPVTAVTWGRPAGLPVMPATEAVLGVAARAELVEEVVSVICLAARERLVAPARLGELLVDRRHRWRDTITKMVADVGAGAQSYLEVSDLANDRRHGLPVGQRQVRLHAGGVRSQVDVLYRVPETGARVIKELDGRLGHEESRFRDRLRDNAAALAGRASVRFGYEDVLGDSCGVAAVWIHVLRQWGWRGDWRPCSHACRTAAALWLLERQFPVTKVL